MFQPQLWRTWNNEVMQSPPAVLETCCVAMILSVPKSTVHSRDRLRSCSKLFKAVLIPVVPVRLKIHRHSCKTAAAEPAGPAPCQVLSIQEVNEDPWYEMECRSETQVNNGEHRYKIIQMRLFIIDHSYIYIRIYIYTYHWYPIYYTYDLTVL